MRFRSTTVDAMPEDVVQDLIAHELAHVVQFARGIRCVRVTSRGIATFQQRDGSCYGGNYEIEQDADESISSWGFDPESLDHWALATGRSKVIEVESPRAYFMALLRRQERYGR
jgi:hypothetical protein